jgi:hypothetical protein
MTTVCITGCGDPALEQAASLLHHAGMALARPTEHARAITVQQWHEQILARAGDDATALQSPSRMWEQLAADLMIANLESACWGWASALSVPLLEFWSSFDPQIRFVLVCEPLDRMVAQLICEGCSTKDLPELIAQWHKTHETLLRFHLRHQQTSMLLWGHTLASHGQEHLKNWASTWQLSLNPAQEPAATAGQKADTLASNALLSYLAQGVIDRFPTSLALSEELAASVWTADFPEVQSRPSQPDVESLVSALQLLQAEVTSKAVHHEQALAEARLIQRLNEVKQQASNEQTLRQKTFDRRYIEQQQVAEASQTQLHQVKEELTRAAKSLSALSAERDALALDKSKSEAALNDATAESELLLTQLHQVQEELERQFLACQELKTRLDVQAKANSAITAERDALKLERDALNQDKVNLTKARDTELKAKNTLQSEREQLVSDKSKSEAALKDATAENELLLTQLHQVQEELERQFLDNQANKLQLHQATASLSRVMTSYPGAFDCESLQLVSGGGISKPWRWHAKNLRVAGHHVEQLEFETYLEQGVTAIALERGQGKAEPMLRWPPSAKDKNNATLLPLNKEQDGVNHLAVYAQLSTSDWDMTQGLHQVLVRHLAQGRSDVPVAEQTALLQASAKARELTRLLQDLMRFDAVTLADHQATDSREVLSFKFKRMSFRNVRLGDFEFQLQAQPLSDGQAKHLGGTVHLIVGRDTATAPFDPWFSNASDGSGRPVMAIPLSERGPMAATWERLSIVDRAFFTALVNALQLALALLSANGKKLPRPWKDWSDLVAKIRQWVRLPPAVEPIQPALAASALELSAPTKRQRQKALSLAPAKPARAKKAPATTAKSKIATPIRAASKVAALPQTRGGVKKSASHRSARVPVSARAGK